MSSLVSYIKSNCASAWSGRVWLDVEGSQVFSYSFQFIFFKNKLSFFTNPCFGSIGLAPRARTRTGTKPLLTLAPLWELNAAFTRHLPNGLPFLDLLPSRMEAIYLW